MLRLYDWTCDVCGSVHEDYVSVPSGSNPPDSIELDCDRCGSQSHTRNRINMIAKPLFDRPSSPMVAGGNFDTVGKKSGPRLPEFDGETAGDFRDFVSKPEYKEIKAERENVKSMNQAKRTRAKLIKSGANVDVRQHPLPGDPKI